MNVEININSLDVINAMAYAQLHDKGIALICALFTSGIGFVGVWAMGFPFRETVLQTLDFVNWIFGLFIVGLMFTIVVSFANPSWRKGRLGLHTIEIDDSGVVEKTEYNHTKLSWRTIKNIKVSRSKLLFLHSGGDVFLVPSRSFHSEKSYREFCDEFLELSKMA